MVDVHDASEISRILSQNDEYKILGLGEDTSTEQAIQTAQKLLLKYHPDRALNNDPAILREIVDKIRFALSRLKSKEDRLTSFGKNFSTSDLKAHHPFIAPFKEAHRKMFDNVFSLAISTLQSQLTGNDHSTVQQPVSNKHDDHHFMSIYHREDILCLGLTLGWIKSVTEDDESQYIHDVKSSYISPASENIHRLGKIIHPLIQDEAIVDKIEKRTLSECFDAISHDSERFMSTPTRYAWNQPFEEFMSLLTEQLELSPNIPFLIYNKGKNPLYYLGVIRENNQYKVFSPYVSTWSSLKNELIDLNHDELTDILRVHFYSTDPSKTVSMSVTSFLLAPIETKPQHQALSCLASTGSTLSLQEGNFIEYLLKNHAPSSEIGARQVLESIKEGHVAGLLKTVIKNQPKYFTRALMTEYLIKEITEEHHFLPSEICFSSDSAESNRYYADQYLIQYLLHSNHLKQIEQVINIHHRLTLQPRSFINAQTMNQILPRLSRLILTAPWSGDSKNEHLEIKNRIEMLLGYLITNQVPLHQNEGPRPERTLGYALLMSKQIALLNTLIQRNLISFNTRDSQGKTLLNHASRMASWTIVDCLLEKNATFSTGKSIAPNEIPHLHGYISRKNPHMIDLTQPFWLNLETEDRDLFQFLLLNQYHHREDLDKFQLIFMPSIRSNPIPYLLASQDHHRRREIIHLSRLNQKQPPQHLLSPLVYRQDDTVRVSIIANQPKFKQATDIPSLIGMKRQDAEQIISKLFDSPITACQRLDSDEVYYTTDPEFLENMLLIFRASSIASYLTRLINQIAQTDQIIDLGLVAKTLGETLTLLKDLPENHFTSQYQMLHHLDNDFTFEKYHRRIESLCVNNRSINVMLKFDEEGVVYDFYGLLHHVMLKFYFVNDYHSNYLRTLIDIQMFLANIHELQCYLEHVTPLKFTQAPLPETMDMALRDSVENRTQAIRLKHHALVEWFKQVLSPPTQNSLYFSSSLLKKPSLTCSIVPETQSPSVVHRGQYYKTTNASMIKR